METTVGFLDQETLRTLIELFGGALVLPLIGVLKRLASGTWIDDYLRWELITGLILIGITFIVCRYWLPTLTLNEIVRTGMAVAGGASMWYGGKKTVDVVVNKNNHSS